MLLSISDKIDEVFSSWDGFLLFFGNKIYQISGIHKLNLKTVGVFLLITLISLMVEYALIKDKKKSSFHRLKKLNKSAINDMVSWLLSGLQVFGFIGVVMTLGIFYTINWLITNDINVFATNYIELSWLQFILVFILTDLKGYFNHRMFHALKPLWELHAFHHSATEFNVLSAQRGHFVEGAVVIIVDTLFWKLIGASPINIIYIGMLVQIQQGLLHSNLYQNWGFLGKYVFVSPKAHKIHHSIEPKHFDKNFGVIFIFWDRLFGSYTEEKNESAIEIGIPNNPYNKENFVKDIWTGYKRFFLKIFRP